MTGVKATILPAGANPSDGPPGSILFIHGQGGGGVVGLATQCPCGCGHETYLNVSPDHPGGAWEFNGDLEKPTLSPSVYNKALPCQWHGWLRDGEWRSV